MGDRHMMTNVKWPARVCAVTLLVAASAVVPQAHAAQNPAPAAQARPAAPPAPAPLMPGQVVPPPDYVIGTDDVPIEIRTQRSISLRPKRERRRTVADDLLKRMLANHESFWTVVYPLYMQREITRGNLRELISKGLEEAKGNYKIVTRLFNMEPGDYKRFLNFLRKHDCQLPFRDYR